MKNLKFSYMYRDGDNYKKHGEIVFNGCPGDIEAYKALLETYLEEGEYFIAAQINVPEVFLWDGDFDYCGDSDHCFHEFVDVEETDEKPTDMRNPIEFIQAVSAVNKAGWQVFDPELRLLGVG